jgi:hypothetical protein
LLLDLLQLRGGELVTTIGDVRSRVELLELCENALRLGLLLRDRGCSGRRRDCDAEQSN